jgi:hypothetical protein
LSVRNRSVRRPKCPAAAPLLTTRGCQLALITAEREKFLRLGLDRDKF